MEPNVANVAYRKIGICRDSGRDWAELDQRQRRENHVFYALRTASPNICIA